MILQNDMQINESNALKLQKLDKEDKVLVLCALVSMQNNRGVVTQAQVRLLSCSFAIPIPARLDGIFRKLTDHGYLMRMQKRGTYKVTPRGIELAKKELAAIDKNRSDERASKSTNFHVSGIPSCFVPSRTASSALYSPVQEFLKHHPFDNNVMGLTRYPRCNDSLTDPVSKAISAVKCACADQGLEFHLASDEALVDDLWGNVQAHMWSCKYGIAIFENSINEGLNDNLLIEIGAMMMSGRRCVLLKDTSSIKRMPTDMAGLLYKDVDISSEESVYCKVTDWIIHDLRPARHSLSSSTTT